MKGELPEPKANVPYTCAIFNGTSNGVRASVTVILAGITTVHLPNGIIPPVHVFGSLKAPL